MIDADEPAAPTILYAGTRPPPRPRRRLSGDNRSLMIVVLATIAVLGAIFLVIAAILVQRGIRAFEASRHEQAPRPPAVVAVRGIDAAPVPPPVPRKGFVPPAPRGNQGEWFAQDAYPPEARRRGEQGRVVVNLAIDAQGRVAGCEVVESSGSVRLDSQTCALARRHARFIPAYRDGIAIAGSYRMRGVRWRLDPVE